MDITEHGPVGLSDARGWELAITLTRMTEGNLMAAFNAVPRTDPHYEYIAANALQVFAAWRPSLFDVPVFLRRMADMLVSHSDLRQLPFSSRFTPVVTERLPKPQQKAFTTYQPMSYYDILTESAIQAISEWLTIEHSNMAALEQFGPGARRVPYALSSLGFGQAVEPHDVLVISECFLSRSRETFCNHRSKTTRKG